MWECELCGVYTDDMDRHVLEHVPSLYAMYDEVSRDDDRIDNDALLEAWLAGEEV